MKQRIYASALFVLLAVLACSPPSHAQAPATVRLCNGTQPNCPLVGPGNPLPVSGSITANLGGFNAESNLTPFTATTGGVASGSFTAGKTIVVSNVGTTNTAYCKLGAASTTSGQPILPGSWFAFTSIAETQVACATSTSTTLVNVAVGTGLPTGAGGGGGGATSAVAITPVSSSALAANQIIKASAGTLSSFNVSADSTLSGAAWWIMVYNATSAPADGAVTPLKCYAMASGTTSYASAFTAPITFSAGITIGVSTTGCFTKTASTHAFISGDAQ